MNIFEQRNEVLSKRPVLKNVLEAHGNKTIQQYFSERIASFPKKVFDQRKNELLEMFFEKTAVLLGTGVAKKAVAHLKKHFYVSTADHHGPVTHPFFVNSNLFMGLHSQHKENNSVIVLSCAGVSLNNSSFPRGLLYTTDDVKKHLPIFSLKYRHTPMFGMRAYDIAEAYRLYENIKEVSPSLAESLESIYCSSDALQSQSYSDQVTKTNFKLWKLLPAQQEVNLIYISQEELVNDLILKHHLEGDSEVYKLLFNEKWHSKFLEYFNDIPGAFTEDSGTFLFWCIKDGKRIRLQKDGQQLVSVDNPEYGVNLNPESLSLALSSKRLMPSMALSFIVLSFYYGLNCAGGFSQVDYLTKMKNNYTRMLNDLGVAGDDVLKTIVTDFYAADLGLRINGDTQMTSLDLLLAVPYSNTEKKISENFNSLTLNDSFDLMAPEFYKIIFSNTNG